MSNPLISYSSKQIDQYVKELTIVGSLSNLYSESDSPLIYYRSTEHIYVRCFGATDVSRKDCTADAIVNKTGVGIKTFLDTTANQKIAEFNKQLPLYKNLSGLELIKAISFFRNERIDITMRTYGLSSMIYHCIIRGKGHLKLYEEPMHKIQIDKIKIIKDNGKNIKFTDGIEIYEFVKSKSTLYKTFNLESSFKTFKVQILTDPMDQLNKFFASYEKQYGRFDKYIDSPKTSILIIPLYVSGKNGSPVVNLKSGLNQWNAGGRKRDYDEVYIPYPAKLRKAKPGFFPPRNVKWKLKLPNGKTISMKVCQDNSKALMSDPNKALGKWILRDVLNLKKGQLLTYDYLLKVGIDSVKFVKDPNGFSVDFITSQ